MEEDQGKIGPNSVRQRPRKRAIGDESEWPKSGERRRLCACVSVWLAFTSELHCGTGCSGADHDQVQRLVLAKPSGQWLHGELVVDSPSERGIFRRTCPSESIDRPRISHPASRPGWPRQRQLWQKAKVMLALRKPANFSSTKMFETAKAGIELRKRAAPIPPIETTL